jgi:hypothetical protein
VGVGIALVLLAIAEVFTDEPLAEVVAIAPVMARATTRQRTMIFMGLKLLWLLRVG